MPEITFSLVDDDSSSIDIINASILSALKDHGYTAISHRYSSAKAFLADYSSNPVQVLFCDIEMPDMDGITLVSKIPEDKRPDVIFVSNREDLVFDSLKVHPFGFIRKKNFLSDIKTVIGEYLARKVTPAGKKIQVETKEGEVSLDIADIVYIESDKKEQIIHLRNKKTVVSAETLQSLYEPLENYGFIQTHKAFIVNFQYIYSIVKGTVHLSTGEDVYLSRRKESEVKEKYLDYMKKNGQIIY